MGIYGICAGTIPVLTADMLTLVVPDWWWLHDVAVATIIFIPMGNLVALGRFNLYDIDSLLTSTILYTLVWAMLLWGLLIVVPLIAQSFGAALGLPPLVATIAFSGLMAFAIVMLARWLGPLVERVLFKDALRAAGGRESAHGRDPRDRRRADVARTRRASALRGLRISELRRLRADRGSWVPSLSIGDFRGREIAPDLARHGVLIPSIEETAATLDMETWRESHPTAAIPIDDRLVLEHLAPHVVMPIRSDGTLAAARSRSARSAPVTSTRRGARPLDRRSARPSATSSRGSTERGGPRPGRCSCRHATQCSVRSAGWDGVVYRVRHVTLETDFALKILKPELARHADLVQRFLREARIMSRLRHPNIVRVFDVDAENGMYSLVMEHVKGRSLKALLETSGPSPSIAPSISQARSGPPSPTRTLRSRPSSIGTSSRRTSSSRTRPVAPSSPISASRSSWTSRRAPRHAPAVASEPRSTARPNS